MTPIFFLSILISNTQLVTIFTTFEVQVSTLSGYVSRKAVKLRSIGPLLYMKQDMQFISITDLLFYLLNKKGN